MTISFHESRKGLIVLSKAFVVNDGHVVVFIGNVQITYSGTTARICSSCYNFFC